MNLSENALEVLKERYLVKDISGSTIESPEDMLKRVAKAVSAVDMLYNKEACLEEIELEFFEMMDNLEFLPNSPTLMNAGKPLGQLNACFVIPIGDSMEEIFEALKITALVHKSGGGTGFSFSRLRPKGSIVNSTGGKSSGPISFMRLFNLATEVVRQGGKRRGANMGILNIEHPDIIEFITCKNNSEEFQNFNLSVGLDEEFFRAVISDNEYNLINPYDQTISKRISAKEIFELIVQTAWKSGEPGIIFLDRLNHDNPTPELGIIESTNPCGEQPLLPYESCNLGSINLSLMVKNFSGKSDIDYSKLASTISKAVHFLDNVIDANVYPLQLIRQSTLKTRKIGLGVMGFAEMLCKLGIPYNSYEALKTAETVMRFISSQSRQMSSILAEKKGVFPEYHNSKFKDSGIYYRNATTTTIAPTGTISIIANTSSGIEPFFALSYIRKVMGREFLEVNSLFKDIAAQRGIYSDELAKIVAQAGSIQNLNNIPEDIRRIFVTAYDIEPEWHVRMQAAFQKYTDNAVSKTVNLKHEASYEDVANIFMLAYDLGLKGITVYRDRSRKSQVLTAGNNAICLDCG